MRPAPAPPSLSPAAAAPPSRPNTLPGISSLLRPPQDSILPWLCPLPRSPPPLGLCSPCSPCRVGACLEGGQPTTTQQGSGRSPGSALAHDARLGDAHYNPRSGPQGWGPRSAVGRWGRVTCVDATPTRPRDNAGGQGKGWVHCLPWECGGGGSFTAGKGPGGPGWGRFRSPTRSGPGGKDASPSGFPSER